jgi:MFS family permease
MARLSPLVPFRVRSFRFQWPADLLTSWAFEMENLILGWYVLVSSDSVLLLSLFGALMWVGTLVAPMFGVIGDRIGHRNLLFGMRIFYLLLASILAALAFSKHLSPAYVLIITVLAGIVRPSDLGVRNALIGMTVPFELLIGAASILRTTSDVARILGALAGAGLFVAFGIGPSYLAVAGCYIAGALLLFGVGPELHAASLVGDAKPLSPWRDLIAGLAYVRDTPRLACAMSIAFVINLTAFPLMMGLMPYVAREVYHVDQTGLGYLVASLAVGAVLGSVILAALGEGAPLPRLMISAILCWYVLLVLFAHMSNVLVGMILLLLIGMLQSFAMVSLTAILLRTCEPRFRGRVMGVRMLAIYGLPVGILSAGALIEHVGYIPTVMLFAAVGLTIMAVIFAYWREDMWRAEGESLV